MTVILFSSLSKTQTHWISSNPTLERQCYLISNYLPIMPLLFVPILHSQLLFPKNPQNHLLLRLVKSALDWAIRFDWEL